MHTAKSVEERQAMPRRRRPRMRPWRAHAITRSAILQATRSWRRHGSRAKKRRSRWGPAFETPRIRRNGV